MTGAGAGARWKRLPRAARAGVYLALALGVLWLARVPMLVGMGEFLAEGEAPPAGGADFIVVLGGDAPTRTARGAELYRAGVAPRVLLIRVPDNPLVEHGLALNDTDVNAEMLVRLGVPREAIRVYAPPRGAESTRDEAVALRDLLGAGPPRRIVCVTSWYHTRRARWLLRKTLRDAPVEVAVVGATPPGMTPRNWWRSERGLLKVFEEYLKFVHNWAYG